MRSRAAFATLVLLAGSATAQDTGQPARAEPAERVEVAEPSKSWADWSRSFARDLVASGRYIEAAEEMFAASLYDANEIGLVLDAAVYVVEEGAKRDRGIGRGTPYALFAGHCLILAESRGAGETKLPRAPDEPPDAPQRYEPGDARLHYVHGRLAWEVSDFVVAHRHFKSAFEGGFDRERALAWYFRGAVNAAPTLYDENRLDEGIAELERVLELAPNHENAMGAGVNLADGYRRRKDMVSAERILKEVIARHPTSGEPLFTYGLLLHDQGELDRAAEVLQRSVDNLARDGRPYFAALLERAEVLQKLGRLDEAASATLQFLEIRKDDAEGTYRLSRVRRDEGDLDEAVKLARRALRYQPDDLRYLRNLMNILHRRRRPDEADESAAVTARYERALAEQHDGPQPPPESPPPDDPE